MIHTVAKNAVVLLHCMQYTVYQVHVYSYSLTVLSLANKTELFFFFFGLVFVAFFKEIYGKSCIHFRKVFSPLISKGWKHWQDAGFP